MRQAGKILAAIGPADPERQIESLQLKVARAWLATLPVCNGKWIFHHASLDWHITEDMVVMLLNECLEGMTVVSGLSRNIILAFYQDSLDFSSNGDVPELDAGAAYIIRGLLEKVTEERASEPQKTYIRH